ncbi:basic salivary proline-rich protein 2-like [Corvus moneduloides]|uniref:basic salivary proline-rich protein 2-like n=1 Tax=Corvus moneduloides TaxID=1196302 RepID=UPI0013640CA7|nr:basic salivary proline-rich protein 2-like [Corvus moneduloides]
MTSPAHRGDPGQGGVTPRSSWGPPERRAGGCFYFGGYSTSCSRCSGQHLPLGACARRAAGASAGLGTAQIGGPSLPCYHQSPPKPARAPPPQGPYNNGLNASGVCQRWERPAGETKRSPPLPPQKKAPPRGAGEGSPSPPRPVRDPPVCPEELHSRWPRFEERQRREQQPLVPTLRVPLKPPAQPGSGVNPPRWGPIKGGKGPPPSASPLLLG